MCHAANVATWEALRDGAGTSAGLMVPCPWARDAAAGYRGEDVGVHLTLNSEWERYRWGPITHAPSSSTATAGSPRTIEDLWDHADLDEVRRELRAQVERAILWGFDVSHLDDHMGVLQQRPEFFDVMLDLAVEFRLPLRLLGPSSERLVGFPFRRLAAEQGILSPDHLVVNRGEPARATFEPADRRAPPRCDRALRPPRRRHPRAAGRDPGLGGPCRRPCAGHRPRRPAAALDAAGAKRIGYRALRDLQRAG